MATHEEGARRALLGRLATGLAVIAEPYRYEWTCCWLSYTGPYGDSWGWQMCGGQMPGGLPYGPDGRHVTCGHWHHRTEVFLAGSQIT
jgi:hypothetical protein